MESSMLNPAVKLAVITLLLILSYYEAQGQITTPCSSSAMTFTPCLNFITGSSANGGSPTAQCCDAVKSIMADGVQCACLIITGNVPFSIPFSRPLAISLPKLCNAGVPLRCQANGVPVPAPGPIIFGPTPAPAAHAPIGQGDSKATAGAVAAPSPVEESSPVEISPAESPTEAVTLGPAANPGIRPVFNPNSPSGSNPSYNIPPRFLLSTLLGIMLLKLN